jgi:hypothetical protein
MSTINNNTPTHCGKKMINGKPQNSSPFSLIIPEFQTCIENAIIVCCKNLPQKYINNLIISSNVAHMNKQATSVENLSDMILNIDMHLSTLVKLSRLKNGMNHTLIVSIDVGRI